MVERHPLLAVNGKSALLRHDASAIVCTIKRDRPGREVLLINIWGPWAERLVARSQNADLHAVETRVVPVESDGIEDPDSWGALCAAGLTGHVFVARREEHSD